MKNNLSRLFIVTTANVVMSSGVRLTLLGRAKVHWSVKRGKNNRVHYRAEEIYINELLYVYGSRE